jgi:hypothetical protein
LNLEEIRTLTIRALQNFNSGLVSSGGGLQLSTLKEEVDSIAANSARMSEQDEEKFMDVVHDLMIEGVIRYGRTADPINSQPPFMSITSYGRKALQTTKIIPHDPDGYLDYFKKEVPKVDELILKYLAESIQCFNRNNLLASAVMLGVASEAVFDVLFFALKKKLTGDIRIDKFDKLEKDISIKNRFDAAKSEIMLLKNRLHGSVAENIESEIDGIIL